MRNIVFPVIMLFLSAAAASAQDVTLEDFKNARKQEKAAFEQRRAEEYAAFLARYESAFEEFRRLYGEYVEEEKSVLDLMASDDGIRISPVELAVEPRAETTVSDQRRLLEENLRSIRHLRPEDLVPVLSDKEDSVARIREAAEVMEEIVSGMSPVPEGEDDVPISVPDVVLEPLDTVPAVVPEPVGTLPSAVDSTVARDPSVPSGKPTEYVRISSPFGTRIHPITHKKHTHKGIDLAAPQMTPIYATADGEVTFSGRNGGYGNFVKINHRNGYKTAYAHMHRIAVDKGADVRKGDLIGYVGTTGSSTGNHLHYEVHYLDKLLDPATTM
ncbi:MAG TPA: peptidoglycan DD-metalloendopeptidase family protein [Candidatus Coprenecus pullistercoris]|nr:peptidoglycan DD-metalloendopeptidase family protein [Candidatus Coprenecus pullistercoris]